MYGRIFESLYTGSMVGAGSEVFAVWTYVIAKMREDSQVGAQVELNPKLLGFILGEEPEVIEQVIGKLCSPDPASRSKLEDGRRLIKIGEYDYRVVNGAAYLAIRNAEDKRAYNRDRQAKRRSKIKPEDNGSPKRPRTRGLPLTGEVQAVKAMERGDEETADRLSSETRQEVEIPAVIPKKGATLTRGSIVSEVPPATGY